MGYTTARKAPAFHCLPTEILWGDYRRRGTDTGRFWFRVDFVGRLPPFVGSRGTFLFSFLKPFRILALLCGGSGFCRRPSAWPLVDALGGLAALAKNGCLSDDF
jgi:hypothetical protein